MKRLRRPRTSRAKKLQGRPRAAALATALAAAPLSLASGPALAAYRFGNRPFTDAVNAANTRKKCGLSTNKLTALMLSASIAETVGGAQEISPSPLTVGRYDVNGSYVSTYTPFGYISGPASGWDQRVWWHKGLGLYQIDQPGMPAFMRFNAAYSADWAAKKMADLWCVGGTPGSAWAPWYACSQGKCNTIYQAIYDSASDKLKLNTGLNVDESVSSDGGMLINSCRYKGSRAAFGCAYVNPAASQPASSATQDWRRHVNGCWGGVCGSSGTLAKSPLSYPFYSYLDPTNPVWSATKPELRDWLQTDGAYGCRGSATDPKTSGVRWQSFEGLGSFSLLCDDTFAQGGVYCWMSPGS